MSIFRKDPLEEIRQGQFLHTTTLNWLALFLIFSLFPAGLVLSKISSGCFFYALFAVELLLLAGSLIWLKWYSRRAVYVTMFLILVAVSAMHGFALIYAYMGICSADCGTDSPKISNDIYSATYFSVITWTTLGYGDIQPLGLVRIIASMEAIVGYIFMGVVVGFSAQTTFEVVRQSHTTKTLRDDLSKEVGY